MTATPRMLAAWAVSTLLLVGAACGAKVTPADRAEADRIWQERCANCHGPEGRGDGPGAAALQPTPRDLTSPQWQGSVSDDRIARVIVGGGRVAGLSDQMAANADLESRPAVVAALVERIRASTR